MTKGHFIRLALFVVMTGHFSSACGLRADELRAKLEAKLVEIKRDLFDTRGVASVAVGEFSGAANLEASGGPAISNALIDAFQKVGLTVDRKARIEVAGRFRPGTIKRLAGGTGDISGQTREEQSEKVGRILKKPGAHVGTNPGTETASTRIAADPESPYAIEVLVKSPENDFRPRAATIIEGQAFVALAREQVYAVRLINDSDLDSAVILAVDGLSVFAFSDQLADRDARLIIPKHSNSLIVGWYRNDGPKGSNEFLVARLSEAAVAKQMPQSSSQIGMVTATFAAAWPKDAPAPPGEEPFIPTKDDLATAIGKPIDQPFKRVDYLFGKTKAAITVRYNKPVEPKNLPR